MKSHLQVKVETLSKEMTYIRRQEEKWKNRARFARQKQVAAKDAEERAKAESSQSYAELNFWSQRTHRVGLKTEARWNHLAYGFMKGRSYEQMENICFGGIPKDQRQYFNGRHGVAPDWARIEEIITRFAKDEPNVRDIMQNFGSWLASAKVWLDGNPDRIKAAIKVRAEEAEARVSDASYQKLRTEVATEAEAFGRQAHEEGWRKINGRWRNPQAQQTQLVGS